MGDLGLDHCWTQFKKVNPKFNLQSVIASSPGLDLITAKNY